jgi:ATP-dependent DNA ligase
MSRVIKRSASQAVKSGRSRRDVPLPQFVPPQLSQPVQKPPSGPQWVHEIKLDGYRMAARIDKGRAQLLTRTGLDWTDKYPSVIAALANLNAKTAYIDGELCGVDEAGLPSFAQTQAATDGEREVRLVYYAFGEFVIVGWSDPEGSRPYLGALRLGYYSDDGELTYAGRVGTGMPVKVLADLRRRLDPLARKTSPLSTPPPRGTRFGSPLVLSRVHWVEPKLVVEITYLTWTADNLLRHTVYVGLREDKPAEQVLRGAARG